VCEGGVCTPISNPNRILTGTSGNLLKGVVLLSNFSHSSGMNGVLMIKRSCDDVAELGRMGAGAAEGAKVFATGAGGTRIAA
jgi:hypothetical protein